MARLLVVFATALFLAPVHPVAAQKITKIQIAGLDDGMLFPVNVRLHYGPGGKSVQFNGNAKKGEVTHLLDVDVGAHIVQTVHYRLGFPQPVVYRVETPSGKTYWQSEPTVDPRRVVIPEAGYRLVVLARRPLESYNAKFFQVRGINCALVLPRPYWFQDVAPGKFKGKEAFPNSLLFHVSKDWGSQRVFHDLAEITIQAMHDEKAPEPVGDYRIHHQSLLISLDAKGKIPDALKKLPKATLQKELTEALLNAFNAMKKEKCYRPFTAAEMNALIHDGYLSLEFTRGEAIVTFAQGLQMAEPLLKKWREEKQ